MFLFFRMIVPFFMCSCVFVPIIIEGSIIIYQCFTSCYHEQVLYRLSYVLVLNSPIMRAAGICANSCDVLMREAVLLILYPSLQLFSKLSHKLGQQCCVQNRSRSFRSLVLESSRFSFFYLLFILLSDILISRISLRHVHVRSYLILAMHEEFHITSRLCRTSTRVSHHSLNPHFFLESVFKIIYVPFSLALRLYESLKVMIYVQIGYFVQNPSPLKSCSSLS